jgi:hypothetical protein|tara:strand:- start:2842 stop:3078 length:237 start_codon:yes stop_codon:yes gene_type:complete
MSVLKQHQDWMTKHYETLLNYKLVHFQIETDEIEEISYPTFTLIEAKTGEIRKIRICDKHRQDEGHLMIAKYGEGFTI